MSINFDNTQKQTILIVDDSEMNRSILVDALGDGYDIIEATDGTEAIAMLQKHLLDISLVLLDVVMPRMDGFEVLTVMNQKHWIEDIPVIMITAESDSSNVKRAYELGVTDFITRPFDMLIVRARVHNTILLYTKQKKLIGMLTDQIYENERRSRMMVDILSHIVEFRNGESGIHIIRVRTLTEMFLRQLRGKTDRYALPQEEIALISTASSLHDIGKIAIEGSILNKPGRLTPEEFEVIKTHPTVGADMLKNLPAYSDNDPLIKTAYEICRWHHERYDGRGYPDGLKGDDIPISAQVVALADVYDALTSDRCYKKAYPHDTAVQMILDGECGTFNPLLLECLRDVAPTMEQEIPERLARSSRPELNIHRDLIPSERTLRLLDYERMKYNFFAAMTEEIQFEYTVTPSILTLSGWGAKKLGLDEIVMNPEQSDKIRKMIGPDTWQILSGMLRRTTPEHPVISYEFQILFGDEPRWNRMIARSIWSSDSPAEFTGAIGKFVDIHEAWMELKNLKRQASHDTLTGLLNHAYAKERIESKLSSGPDGNYLLAIIDVDHFKSVNDSCGHMFGDDVLKHVSDMLRQSVPKDNIFARIGGDEFLFFLEISSDGAAEVNRIFNAITAPYEGFPISVSVGVARTDMVGYKYEKLFHAADQALYYAKRSGRCRYHFYDDSICETLSVNSLTDQNKGE